MGLTTWKKSPRGPIRRADVDIAKNHLSEAEITELNRIVSMDLDYAEDQARKRKPMHMREWAEKLDGFLRFNEREVLQHKGTITHELAAAHARNEFEKFEDQRRALEASQPSSDFDHLLDQTRRLDGEAPQSEASAEGAAEPQPQKKAGRRKKISDP
jgi:hypothetical protein